MLTNYQTKEQTEVNQDKSKQSLQRQILLCQNINCKEMLSNHFVTKSEINKKQKLQIKCWRCGEMNNY